MVTFSITADFLNLRNSPKQKPDNVIIALPHDHEVTKLEEIQNTIWWKVRTIFDGRTLTGFISKRFLQPANLNGQTSFTSIGPVHLSIGRPHITRRNEHGQAHSLGEESAPRRILQSSSVEKVQKLHEIIDWLDVGNEEHLRYKPGTNTYCNIYAYDYCFLANVYLPRVWWKPKALQLLSQGESVSPKYNVTITELNANALLEWFKDFGADFGWRQIIKEDPRETLTEVQNAANQGKVCIISAQRTNLNRSGHICAVVPEKVNHQAERDGGFVIRPLQSQAGRFNRKYFTRTSPNNTSNWWLRRGLNGYRDFGFWVND